MISFIVSMLPDEFLPLIIAGGGLAIILGLVAPRAFLGFLGLLLLFTIAAPLIENIMDMLPLWVLLIIFAVFILFILRIIFGFLLGQYGGEAFVARLFYDFLRLFFRIPFIILRGICRFFGSLLSMAIRALSTRRRLTLWIIVLLTSLLLFPSPYIEAKSPVQVAGKAATRGIMKKIGSYRIKNFGARHIFKRDTKLIRFTNHPSIDKRLGLKTPSFWIKSRQGKYGSAEHLRKKLALSHPVKAGEKMTANKGWPYFERPIKKGQANMRETILLKPVRGKSLAITKPLQNLSH